MAKDKPWSKTVTAHGISIRLFERGGTIYRSMKLGRTVSENGKPRTEHAVKSLGHADRALAEEQMRDLCAKLKNAELNPDSTEAPLSVGSLRDAYLRERGPLLSPDRLRTVKAALGLLAAHMGDSLPVHDIDKHRIDTYVHARRTGTLRPDDYRSRGKVGSGTIRNEVHILSTVCAWATGYRVNKKPLLSVNPVRGLKVPEEANPKRPVARPDRYERLAKVAGTADPSGQFALMLELAWRTGRRINAILHMTAADVLLEPDAVFEAFAEAGQDDEIAREWTGALRWRAEWDKKGYETFSPMPDRLRPALAAYMRDKGIIGGGWLFPAASGKPANKARADYLLRLAEKAAGLPRMNRGGWHAFRRGWASLRKSLPVQDVMVAGGWRDADALRKSYQGADSRTVRDVVNL
jgi:integrase